MRKQEVETENHGQHEFHLIEINEDDEGGETTGGSVGENVVIALSSIAVIVFLCICSGCSFLAYRCGLCPKRRESRRRHLSLSSISSGHKRPQHEELELVELRKKLQTLSFALGSGTRQGMDDWVGTCMQQRKETWRQHCGCGSSGSQKMRGFDAISVYCIVIKGNYIYKSFLI